MRIVYGVNGYGRGHATRAMSVLSGLVKQHEVLVLAGADAYDTLHNDFRTILIPTLGYQYRRNGTRSNWLTAKYALPGVLDLWLRGPAFAAIQQAMHEFGTQVAISDAEPWTHRVAQYLGIPRIGFDHFGIMAYCRPDLRPTDHLISMRDARVYRLLMGQPDRVLVSSFFDAPPLRDGVRVVPALLREEVFEYKATRGDHILAYFNKGKHLFSKRIEKTVRGLDCPVIIYGTGRIGTDGNLEFRPPGNRTFLEALASCRAVVSTAGNQLVGEALHFGKPMLVMPEDCPEQRMNGRALARMGIGMQVPQRRFGPKVCEEFLRREPEFVATISSLSRDGRAESLEALNTFLHELTGANAASKASSNVA